MLVDYFWLSVTIVAGGVSLVCQCAVSPRGGPSALSLNPYSAPGNLRQSLENRRLSCGFVGKNWFFGAHSRPSMAAMTIRIGFVLDRSRALALRADRWGRAGLLNTVAWFIVAGRELGPDD